MTDEFSYMDVDDDDQPLSDARNTSFDEIAEQHLSRRSALKGLIGTAAAGALSTLPIATRSAMAASASTLSFANLAHKIGKGHAVASGYHADVLIRWGDKVLEDAPAFDSNALKPAAQAKQFGYNNDFIGFMPLPMGSKNSGHGLLCVNHEYTNGHLMRAGIRNRKDSLAKSDKVWVGVEMAAHGHSVIEIRKQGNHWSVVEGGKYARRITPMTEMRLSGPAAGHDRLKTSADPTGKKVLGTINNCAGGTTPWGTVLIAEENFHGYFGGDPKRAKTYSSERRNFKRYGIAGRARYGWYKFHSRFDVEKEPNEPNRFGYIVEFDPYDPNSIPVKRTALGRAKHEGANVWLQGDNRVVAYSGDDQHGDYLYKFVCAQKFNPADRSANLSLLDSGTLFVARFNADGSLDWLPLVQGRGALTAQNGFHAQADVCIETRRAADLVGATRMDRPEDVEVNPVTGKVYVMLTNNKHRGRKHPLDKANPRAKNRHGHIIEITAPGGTGKSGDHASAKARWDIFLLAGNPKEPGHAARYNSDQPTDIWFAAPDNCAFDKKGRLWVSTDQGSRQRKNNIPDGMYAMEVTGPAKAMPKFFFACPADAEMCGPEFTPDGKTLFVAVQHPGEAKGSSFDRPSTRWPDFQKRVPPRPSVVAITRKDGGIIGG